MTSSCSLCILAMVLFCSNAVAEYQAATASYSSSPVDHRLSLLEHLNGEISSLRRTLPGAIQLAADAISKENAKSNLRQLSYGLGVFAGTALSIASAYEALPDKDEIPNTFVFTQTSVALNGWSFGGIWVAEGQLSDPVVKCGAKDFEQAMDNFEVFEDASLRAAESTLLDASASGINPFDVVQKHHLSENLRLSLSGLDESLRVGLSCVLSKSGSDANALTAQHMLDKFLSAHAQRIDILEAVREDAFEKHLEENLI